MDAKKNLTTSEYDKVMQLFEMFKQNKENYYLNLNGYMNLTVKIIKTFDEIAPYEKYSGYSEKDGIALMNEIRYGDTFSKIEPFNLYNNSIEVNNSFSDNNYYDKLLLSMVEDIIAELDNRINYSEALEFVDISTKLTKNNKNNIAHKFVNYYNKMADKYDNLVANSLLVMFFELINQHESLSDKDKNKTKEKIALKVDFFD